MSNLCIMANSCRRRKNDTIFTPKPLALRMIEVCNITPEMKVLDPCYGGGVFYENFPECNKSWCEIDKGKDFFDETDRYDLIIGNPPFSMFSKWLQQTVKLTDRFYYIFGAMNFTDYRITEISKLGFNISRIDSFTVDYWFGGGFAVMFERRPDSIISVFGRFCCDVCGKRCNRGTTGFSFNECSPKPERKSRKKIKEIVESPLSSPVCASSANS